MLVPLALLVPGAGAAVDAALLSIGAAEIGIGADDLARANWPRGRGGLRLVCSMRCLWRQLSWRSRC